ncbi:MAG: aminoglycoside phosphotransferase family protein [Methanomicrobiales archaeon]|nr:aminoglycoside phosphotransferase family protein [Methanomicrobiales archaeon]
MPGEWDEFEKLEPLVAEQLTLSRATRIAKGFSFEQKYLLDGENGTRYLLRITATPTSDIAGRKRQEYETLCGLGNYSSLVPRTFAFGTSRDGSLCFMVLSYFDGMDGEEALGSLSETEQYRLGVQAGRELRNLHAMPAPAGRQEWCHAFREKISGKLRRFSETGIELAGIDPAELVGLIQRGLPGIQSVRQTFLHDDYHPANLIVRHGGLAGIIDFNRYDWGDPVHDFIKMAYFSRALSIPFSAGQVHGYFGGGAPMEFCNSYSFYCAATIVSDILWSHWYEETSGSAGEVARSEKRIRMVVSDHEEFTTNIPRWYREYMPPGPTERGNGTG